MFWLALRLFLSAFVWTLSGAAFSNAKADSIRGFVFNLEPKAGILLDNKTIAPQGTRLPIRPIEMIGSLAITKTFKGLQTGDFVTVSGDLLDRDADGIIDHVQVDGVESVGVKKVLGIWLTEDFKIVNFEDFNRVSIYQQKIETQRPIELEKLKDLNYTLAPDHDSVYSIFLVERGPSQSGTYSQNPAAPFRPVHVGKLEITEKSLELEIVNPKTGKSSGRLRLSPIRN